jgi:hypothetical protein
MNKTKEILESAFDCSGSHGNFVIFKEAVPEIADRFLVKHIENIGTRMALVDELTLYQYLGK